MRGVLLVKDMKVQFNKQIRLYYANFEYMKYVHRGLVASKLLQYQDFIGTDMVFPTSLYRFVSFAFSTVVAIHTKTCYITHTVNTKNREVTLFHTRY